MLVINNFLNPDSIVMTKKPIPEYEGARAIFERFQKHNGNQSGDPNKAAAAMIKVGLQKNSPLY